MRLRRLDVIPLEGVARCTTRLSRSIKFAVPLWESRLAGESASPAKKVASVAFVISRSANARHDRSHNARRPLGRSGEDRCDVRIELNSHQFLSPLVRSSHWRSRRPTSCRFQFRALYCKVLHTRQQTARRTKRSVRDALGKSYAPLTTAIAWEAARTRLPG